MKDKIIATRYSKLNKRYWVEVKSYYPQIFLWENSLQMIGTINIGYQKRFSHLQSIHIWKCNKNLQGKAYDYGGIYNLECYPIWPWLEWLESYLVYKCLYIMLYSSVCLCPCSYLHALDCLHIFVYGRKLDKKLCITSFRKYIN